MQLDGVLSQFAHRSQHRQTPVRAGKFAQGHERRLHRIGIRIVGIVDDPRAMGVQHLHPRAGKLYRLQPARNLVQSQSAFGAHCGGEKRIARHDPVDHRQAHVHRVAIVRKTEGKNIGVDLQVLRSPSRIGTAADPDHARVRAARDAPAPLVVAVQDCQALRRQRRDQLRLFGGDGGLVRKKFDMRRPDAADHADLRRGHFRQRREFAGMIHPHFHHAVFVILVEPDQGQRHADVIVEIALRRLRLETGAQHGRDQFLRARLAAAAGHADGAHGKQLPVIGGKALQGLERVGHLDKTEVLGQIGDKAARNQRRHRAVLSHLADKFVAVKAISLQRHKAIAGCKRPRVGMEPVHRQRRIALDQPAAGKTGDLFQGAAAHHAALLCRNSCTTIRSSNGWNWPAISCVVS